MKRHIIPCILSLTLLLTACGGEQAAADTAEEAVKDHYYQILDAAGKELYTVTDSGAVAEIDALINKAGGENADHGNAEGATRNASCIRWRNLTQTPTGSPLWFICTRARQQASPGICAVCSTRISITGLPCACIRVQSGRQERKKKLPFKIK